MRYPPLPWPEDVPKRPLMKPFWREVVIIMASLKVAINPDKKEE